jgi:hypothetical protein
VPLLTLGRPLDRHGRGGLWSVEVGADCSKKRGVESISHEQKHQVLQKISAI